MRHLKKSVFLATLLVIVLVYYLLGSYKTPGFSAAGRVKSGGSCPDCNVVVILVDTLRADHLPTYGYQRDTAPFITSLMDKSTVFERAFSSSCWTAPATASVFTSKLPSDHGVITGFLATKSMLKKGNPIQMNRLPQKHRTLGEFMADSGYRTVAVADNLNIGTEMGFDRGFELFKKHKEKGAARVNETAFEFLEEVRGKGPYFLYLHYIDPHAPYSQHNPWYDECAATVSQTKAELWKCAYDSEIRYLDGHIEELFRTYDLLNNSIVIFLSDHGEEFWEHGQRGHGKTLYTELIHVPFAIYHPKWKPARVQYNVHTMDLMPTLAGILELDKAPEWKGLDLNDLLKSGAFERDRLIFSERLRTPFSKSKWWKRSVIENFGHYILTGEPGKMPKEELFDLEHDFDEMHDVLKSKPDLARSLALHMATLPSAEVTLDSDSVKVDLDTELAEQLRTLGYLN